MGLRMPKSTDSGDPCLDKELQEIEVERPEGRASSSFFIKNE